MSEPDKACAVCGEAWDSDSHKAITGTHAYVTSEPPHERIARLERRIVERDAELADFARRYDSSVQFLQGRCGEHLAKVEALTQAADTLARSLKLATTRLEIMLGRAHGCDDDRPEGESARHGVTEIEAPDWIDEHRAALSSWDALKEKP